MIGLDNKIRLGSRALDRRSAATITLARPNDAALLRKVHALLDRLTPDPAYHITAVFDHADIRRRGGPAEGRFLVAMAKRFETGRDPAVTNDIVSAYQGIHGYLPEAPEMQSILIVAGSGLNRRDNLGIVDMRAIAPSPARISGVSLRFTSVPAAF